MSASNASDPLTLNRLYGRAVGKPLRSYQQRLVDELLSRLAVPGEGPVTSQHLFGDERPLHFEIGFGGGEHLAFQARHLPRHGFIGAEPFLNGVARALAHIEGDGLSNVRLHHGDALQALERVPDGTLETIYLLHPDPWPKGRHAKRRMMNDGPVRLFARKLRPGGTLRLGTDHPVYLRHALMVMRRFTKSFEWLADSHTSWINRSPDWPETRYEAKARRNGHEVWYFRWTRI